MVKDKLIERMTKLERLLKEFLDTVEKIRKENKLAKEIEVFTLEQNVQFLEKYHSNQAEEDSLKGYQ